MKQEEQILQKNSEIPAVPPKGLILCDAHTHPGTNAEWKERQEKGILSLICASTPPEAEALLSRLGASPESSCLIPTIGLHPWHTAEYKVSDLNSYFSLCPAIGEIGMDSVWCDVPLSIQEDVFRQQLRLACELKKPVILHTKGQEAAIARILPEYPNRYLIHWYSRMEYLEEYRKLGCYFSVGPDVWWNPAVHHVAKTVPLERLLIETDGMNAVQWAYTEAQKALEKPEGLKEPEMLNELHKTRGMAPKSVSGALASTLLFTAELRHLSPEDAGALFRENLFNGFLHSS